MDEKKISLLLNLRDKVVGLVKSRGEFTDLVTTYSYFGSNLTIHYSMPVAPMYCYDLEVWEGSFKVFIADWQASGNDRILMYRPGKWEETINNLAVN